MKTKINDVSPSAYARLAGVLYLIITVAAIVAHMVVPGQFIVPGDAAATVANIAADDVMFRIGVVGGELVVLVSEVALSVLLYVLLKPVSKTLALAAAAYRLVMTAIHGLNLLNYFFVLQLATGADTLSGMGQEQVNALVSLFLDAHSVGFTLGIAILVPHVLILGILIYMSGYFPKVLGILFMAAGVGYLLDATGLLFVPGYTTTPGLIALVIAVAEIAFPVWLLVKGVNMDGWQERALTLETA